MFELVRELHAAKVTLGVISNSEGKLVELIRELGLDDVLPLVVDSGVFGITKPDPRIIVHAAALLGAEPRDIVHVGDSYQADVAGALGVGMRAIYDPAATTSRACGSPMTPPRPARRSRPSASRSPEPDHFGGGGRPNPRAAPSAGRQPRGQRRRQRGRDRRRPAVGRRRGLMRRRRG